MKREEILELVSKNIVSLIKESHNIEPIISEFETMTEEGGEEIGFWNMHFGYFLDICIFIENDVDIYVSLSFYYAVLPNYSAILALEIEDMALDSEFNFMAEISDNFTYDKDYNMVFGDEADKLIQEEHKERINALANKGVAELFFLHTEPGYSC